MVEPVAAADGDGATLIVVSVAGTVMAEVPLKAPLVAVIAAVPALTAVIKPLALTVATAGLLEVKLKAG